MISAGQARAADLGGRKNGDQRHSASVRSVGTKRAYAARGWLGSTRRSPIDVCELPESHGLQSLNPFRNGLLEHVRQRQWYAARTNDEQDRKSPSRRAVDELPLRKRWKFGPLRERLRKSLSRAAQLDEHGLQKTELVVAPFSNSGSL